MARDIVVISVRSPRPDGPEIRPAEAIARELIDDIFVLRDRLEDIERSVDLRPQIAAKKFSRLVEKMNTTIPTTVRAVNDLHSRLSRDQKLRAGFELEAERAFYRRLEKIAKSQLSFWSSVLHVLQRAIEHSEDESRHSLELLLTALQRPCAKLDEYVTRLEKECSLVDPSRGQLSKAEANRPLESLPFDLPPGSYWEKYGQQVTNLISGANLKCDPPRFSELRPLYLLPPESSESLPGNARAETDARFVAEAQEALHLMLYYLHEMEVFGLEFRSWSIPIQDRSKHLIQEIQSCWKFSLKAMIQCLKCGLNVDPLDDLMEATQDTEFLEQSILFAREQLRCRRNFADFMNSATWLAKDEEEREMLEFQSNLILINNQRLADMEQKANARLQSINEASRESTA